MKANNHPLVRDLRRLLDKHGMCGAVLLGMTEDKKTMAVSAGSDVIMCDALGPVLQAYSVDLLFGEMAEAFYAAESKRNKLPNQMASEAQAAKWDT